MNMSMPKMFNEEENSWRKDELGGDGILMASSMVMDLGLADL